MLTRLVAAEYGSVSEVGGTEVTGEGASMAVTRYAVAARAARGRRTIEIACAAGLGLGMLRRSASWLIAGDLDPGLLARARHEYGTDIPLVRFSAQALPFRDGAVECAVCVEAAYYFPELSGVLDEIARILTADGRIVFIAANPERPDFIPSPFSRHYHSAAEYRALLAARGFCSEIFGAFPSGDDRSAGSARRLLVALVPTLRRIANALHLVPRSLDGRARLKRLIFGRLRSTPNRLTGDFAPEEPLVPLERNAAQDYKVIYIVATRAATAGGATA